jgi:DNA-directed RNA polymerase sigma subunit (sigma70/sigma32)
VGRVIGVTKERVRQIQNKALEKLRATIDNEVLVK